MEGVVKGCATKMTTIIGFSLDCVLCTIQPPLETLNQTSFEDWRVSQDVHYSQEQDVYDASGFSSAFIQKVGSVNGITMQASDVTTLVNKFIANVDERIRRLLGVPITIRKEGHEFFNNPTVQLGPEREDPYEFFGAWDPSGKVEDVYAIYYNEYRTKLPYPKNWDQFTEPNALYLWGTDSPNTTIVADTNDFMCGVGSLHIKFTQTNTQLPQPTQYAQFPRSQNLNKRMYPWFYIGMWAKTNNPNAVFYFRFVCADGSYYYGAFQLGTGNTWEVVMLNIRNFAFYDPTGQANQFNWMITYTRYIQIASDSPADLWIDNLNLNDGFFATYPSGQICWCMPNFYPAGRISVTYSYDPFRSPTGSVPEALRDASAKMAGVKLIDWLIGHRQSAIAFDQMSDTLEESPDRETLENTRRRLEQEALDDLVSLGYKTFEGIG
jgi:hypothetical protein